MIIHKRTKLVLITFFLIPVFSFCQSPFTYSDLVIVNETKADTVKAVLLFDGLYDLLFWKGDHFIRKEDGSTILLQEKKAYVDPATNKLVKAKRQFLPILVRLFEDCEDLSFGLLTGDIPASAKARSYVELLKRYHACRGLDYEEPKANIPWSRIVAGIRIGAGVDQFGVYGDNPLGNVTIPQEIIRVSPFQWVGGASGGFQLRFENPRTLPFTSYEIGLNYRITRLKNVQDFSPGTYRGSQFQTAHFEQSWESLTALLGIRRNVRAGGKGFYGKAGFGINLPLGFNVFFNQIQGIQLGRNSSGEIEPVEYAQEPFPFISDFGPNLMLFGELGYQIPFSRETVSKKLILALQPAWEGDMSFGVTAPFGSRGAFSNRNISIKLLLGVDL